MYRFEVPYLPPTLNQFYAGVHWGRRQAWKNAFNSLILAEFRKKGFPKVLKTPITIHCTQFCKRNVRDADNSVIGVKFLQDALVHFGHIPDDNHKHISTVILQTRKGKEDKTVFIISENV